MQAYIYAKYIPVFEWQTKGKMLIYEEKKTVFL